MSDQEPGFNWAEYRASLQVSEDDLSWSDAEDLGRLSVSTFLNEHSGVRRDRSVGTLRLVGDGVEGHSAPLDAVGSVLKNFQRLVLATGLSAGGFKSIQGRLPVDIVSKIRLLLDGVPTPGSLVLSMVPATLPQAEILPDGQTEITPPEESQAVDRAVRDAFDLLESARAVGADLDSSELVTKLLQAGPRVASTLKDFADTLVNADFEAEMTWRQPRQKRSRVSLSRAELVNLGKAIKARQLAKEPVTLVGVLRTVSDLSALKVDVPDVAVVNVGTAGISRDVITSLKVGMRVSIKAEVVEETVPAGDPKLIYQAQSISEISPE